MPFRQPGAQSLVAAVLAVLVHPVVVADAWLPAASGIITGLALLLGVCVLARAGAGRGGPWLAVGFFLTLASISVDAIRGHAGRLTLAPGQTTSTFDELGPAGRTLGLRPLELPVRLDEVHGDGSLRLAGDGVAVLVSPRRAASLGAYRFGLIGAESSGEIARLRLRLHEAGASREVWLAPGATVTSGALRLSLDRYFPDFALDDRGQPFSRTREHRNPAALLHVELPEREYTVFVIQAMPGLHAQPGLDVRFDLVTVEPATSIALRVAQQPARLAAALGLLLVGLGLALEAGRP